MNVNDCFEHLTSQDVPIIISREDEDLFFDHRTMLPCYADGKPGWYYSLQDTLSVRVFPNFEEFSRLVSSEKDLDRELEEAVDVAKTYFAVLIPAAGKLEAEKLSNRLWLQRGIPTKLANEVDVLKSYVAELFRANTQEFLISLAEKKNLPEIISADADESNFVTVKVKIEAAVPIHQHVYNLIRHHFYHETISCFDGGPSWSGGDFSDREMVLRVLHNPMAQYLAKGQNLEKYLTDFEINSDFEPFFDLKV